MQALGGGREAAELDDVGEGSQLIGIERAQSKISSLQKSGNAKDLLMRRIIKQDFPYGKYGPRLIARPVGRPAPPRSESLRSTPLLEPLEPCLCS